MKKPSQSVSYDVQDGVGVLITNNPPVNAMSYHVRQGLVDGLEMAESDEDVQAILKSSWKLIERLLILYLYYPQWSCCLTGQ